MPDMTLTLLKRIVEACALRQEVLASNLANANTPGYTRTDLRFKDALAKALATNDERALQTAGPVLYRDASGRARADGNNVSAQMELGKMAQNRLLYELAAQALSSKYARLRSVIKGS